MSRSLHQEAEAHTATPRADTKELDFNCLMRKFRIFAAVHCIKITDLFTLKTPYVRNRQQESKRTQGTDGPQDRIPQVFYKPNK